MVNDQFHKLRKSSHLLRFMDRIGNRRYNVALPYNYWPKQEWLNASEALGLTLRTWKSKLDPYPRPVNIYLQIADPYLVTIIGRQV